MIGFFALHAITWWIWGDEKLLEHGIEVIISKEECNPEWRNWDLYTDRVYRTDFIDSMIVTVDEIEYKFERFNLGELKDSLLVDVISKESFNPYIQFVRMECGESTYFHMHPYFGDGLIWGFFSWIKLFDEEDLFRWFAPKE